MPGDPIENDAPSSAPAGAEVREVRPCALCGDPTLRAPLPSPAPLTHLPGLCACGPRHERILAEALAGESPSTVLLRDAEGGALALRAYGKPRRVVFVSTVTRPDGGPALRTAHLTPREARRLAGVLLRAARLAEGEPATPMAQA